MIFPGNIILQKQRTVKFIRYSDFGQHLPRMIQTSDDFRKIPNYFDQIIEAVVLRFGGHSSNM